MADKLFYDVTNIRYVPLADVFELGVVDTDGAHIDFRVALTPAITELRWDSATMELVAEFEPGHVLGNLQRHRFQRSQPIPRFLNDLDRYFAYLAQFDRSPPWRTRADRSRPTLLV